MFQRKKKSALKCSKILYFKIFRKFCIFAKTSKRERPPQRSSRLRETRPKKNAGKSKSRDARLKRKRDDCNRWVVWRSGMLPEVNSREARDLADYLQRGSFVQSLLTFDLLHRT